MLHKYWFKFQMSIKDPHPIGTLLGCGVTASDYEDALKLLRERVFSGTRLPTVDRVIEDVNLSYLDPNHVLLNMGNPESRGIWFPLGYDDQF